MMYAYSKCTTIESSRILNRCSQYVMLNAEHMVLTKIIPYLCLCFRCTCFLIMFRAQYLRKMPVPRRRSSSKSTGFSLSTLPSRALRLFDIGYIFQNTRTVLLYGFAPAVITIGMLTEPAPVSWFDIFNLLIGTRT